MLSAAEAREHLPVVDLEDALLDIEPLIREAASKGRLQVDIRQVLPKMEGWDSRLRMEKLDAIYDALRGLGYEVEIFGGDISAPASTTVSWRP